MYPSSTTTRWLLALVMLAGLGLGCSMMPAVMSPKVDAVLRASELGFRISEVRAFKDYTRDWGAGLDIVVWVTGKPDDYARDLQLEIDGAAAVLAALAKSPLSVEWDHVSVRFCNDYGQMPPWGRRVYGVARVLMTRESILKLRAQQALPAEYAKNWNFLHGYKDQPDSKVLLEWKRPIKT
jgi:hypothetical protein